MKDFYSGNPAVKPLSATFTISVFYPKHFGNLSKPSGTCPQPSGNIPKPFGNDSIPGGSIPGHANERFENGFIFRRTYCCCILPLIRIIMRQKRDLAENVWYGVGTAVNVGEPLFKQDWA
jgi:hypothetical protein